MTTLDWISLFESLSEEELQDLSMFCQERYLKSWEVLFKEWDDATAMYIVKSGKLKAYLSRTEWEQTLWYIHKDEFVWEMAFFDWYNIPKKRMATVRAIEDSGLLVIMNYSILDLASKHREIFDKIATIISKRKEDNTSSR